MGSGPCRERSERRKAKSFHLLPETVPNALQVALLADIRCSDAEASLLAEIARQRVQFIGGTEEDTDEDLIHRLQDPRTFGEFVEFLLSDPRLSSKTRTALVERAFDLLPLPRSEADVILVERRASPHLLDLAWFLAEQEAMTVLHVMHLVFAVFLDRRLFRSVDAKIRSGLLSCVTALGEANERLRALYAALHLGTVPESEAYTDLRALLASPEVPDSLKSSLATAVVAPDGGAAVLRRLAKEEGLLPAHPNDVQDASVILNVPRMPPRLKPLGSRWLRRQR